MQTSDKPLDFHFVENFFSNKNSDCLYFGETSKKKKVNCVLQQVMIKLQGMADINGMCQNIIGIQGKNSSTCSVKKF